jgi:CRP-like cAMP-binding protein
MTFFDPAERVMLSNTNNGTFSLTGKAILAGNLFSGLPRSADRKLHKLRHPRVAEKGTFLFVVGAVPETVLILRRGIAEVVSKREDGSQQVVRRVEVGEVLGLTESLAVLPHEMQVRTVTDCEFDYIDRTELLGFLNAEPDACFLFVRCLASVVHNVFKTCG